MRAHCFKVCTC